MASVATQNFSAGADRLCLNSAKSDINVKSVAVLRFPDLFHRCDDSRAPPNHLIDPWQYTTAFGRRWYGGLQAKSQSDMDQIYAGVRDRLKNWPSVRFHRLASAASAVQFPDEFFDWVYIDGNHYYEFVLEDLTLYLPKLRPGGWLAGDDYLWTSEELAGVRPVKVAVDEFVSTRGLRIEFIDQQYLIRL